MKRGLTILAVVLMLMPFVFAQTASLDITKTSSTARISPLGQAAFNVTFKNNQATEDVFLLELSDVRWSLSTKRTYDYTTGISLNSGESYTTIIYIKPGENIAPGTYYVELKARALDTNMHSSEVFAITIDPKVVDYSIKIPSEVLEPTSIDPAKTNSVQVLIKNPYPVDLINLTVTASSKFLNRITNVDIPANSEKVISFALNLDKSTEQQQDNLKVTVTQNGKEISSAAATLYIKEFRQPYKVDEQVSKMFLQFVHDITFTNTEGAQKTLDASFLKPRTYAVIITVPKAVTETFNNQDYLVWQNVTLTPDQTFPVKVIEDYRPLAGAALVVIIIIILYFTYRSPIVVNKKAYGLQKKDTGSNEIKVVLHVKNRTGRTVEKVRVLDRLPVIHRVEEDFGPGTPEPRYRRSGEGIILDWDITLAPKEERIFVYKVKSSLPLVGEYTLKPCVVQYGHKNKRTESSPYTLMID